MDVNKLTVSKIEEFKSIVAHCKNIVRVEIVNCSEFPILVNLYHPTVLGSNLGSNLYFSPETSFAKERKALEDEDITEEFALLVIFFIYQILCSYITHQLFYYLLICTKKFKKFPSTSFVNLQSTSWSKYELRISKNLELQLLHVYFNGHSLLI